MDTARASSPRVGWLLAATPEARGVTFVVVTVLLFGYFSIPSLLFEPDMASRLIAHTSVMAIAPVPLAERPRGWRASNQDVVEKAGT